MHSDRSCSTKLVICNVGSVNGFDNWHAMKAVAQDHVITAADPLPGDLRQAIEAINASS